MSPTVRIMTWEFDFLKMEANIYSSPNSINVEHTTPVKLLIVGGKLHYQYINKLMSEKPRLVANTGHSAFDSAVQRAWSDFCFEEQVLNAKGEDSEQQEKPSHGDSAIRRLGV